MTKEGQIPVLNAMRGIAAFSVAWYHLTNMEYLPETALKQIGSVGWLGVEAFFVISGFVIPYSLLQVSGSRRYGMFLLRRLVRIDPPYLVSIVLSIAIAYAAAATPWYSGEKPHYSIPQVAAHLGYVNNFLGYQQINRVYWTLGIEFQFYILIGLFHRVLVRARWYVFGIVLLGGYCLDLLADKSSPGPEFLIPHWVPLFLMGISVVSFHAGLRSSKALWGRLLLCAAAGLFSLSTPIVAVGLGSALLIAFLPAVSFKSLNWLGMISYSLYLVHVPVGERAMNAVNRVIGNPETCFLLAMGLTVLTALIFNRLVEEPARLWSKKIQDRGAAAEVDVPATCIE